MPERVPTPTPTIRDTAVIERHLPLPDAPFFSVEYLSHEDPAEWAKSRIEALVFDYMAANTLAGTLSSEPGALHAFASTVVGPAHRAREIAPRQRSAREDWRAQTPNCGVL